MDGSPGEGCVKFWGCGVTYHAMRPLLPNAETKGGGCVGMEMAAMEV